MPNKSKLEALAAAAELSVPKFLRRELRKHSSVAKAAQSLEMWPNSIDHWCEANDYEIVPVRALILRKKRKDRASVA